MFTGFHPAPIEPWPATAADPCNNITDDVMASFVDPDAAIAALNDETVGSVAVRRACEALQAEQPDLFVCRQFHVPPKLGIVE